MSKSRVFGQIVINHLCVTSGDMQRKRIEVADERISPKYSFEKITRGTVVYVTCVVLDNAAQFESRWSGFTCLSDFLKYFFPGDFSSCCQGSWRTSEFLHWTCQTMPGCRFTWSTSWLPCLPSHSKQWCLRNCGDLGRLNSSRLIQETEQKHITQNLYTYYNLPSTLSRMYVSSLQLQNKMMKWGSQHVFLCPFSYTFYM